MLTRVLGTRDIRAVVADVGLDAFTDELIARLASALRGLDPELLHTVDRSGFHYTKPDLGLLEWMPAMETGGRIAIKTVGYHPANPVQRAMPSVLATTSVYDTTSGHLSMICEATILTALRTGAASALATDVLAVDGPVHLGIVGCGAQAVAQLHAITRVRDVARVVAYDSSPDVAATFATRAGWIGVPIQVVEAEAIVALVADSDVLITCTSVDPGSGPVVPAGIDSRPWLHVNAVGADFVGKHELPLDLLQRAVVCPDVVSQCLVEGESQQLSADALGPDLVDLVRRRDAHQALRSRTTVFDSTGWALEDLVAAGLLAEHANRIGAGVAVDLQHVPDDPYDPYEAMVPEAERRTE